MARAELAKHSPILADRLAASTSHGISIVARQIMDVVLAPDSGSPSSVAPSLPRLVATLVESNAEPDVLYRFLLMHEPLVQKISARSPIPYLKPTPSAAHGLAPERGKQAEVVTPGNNVKRYLAGSMSWRSGELVVTHGMARNAQLFGDYPEDLRFCFRRHKTIHVICDNARLHTGKGSRLVRKYLEEHGDRIVLHYLPVYSPKHHPIERIWRHLHDQIIRNHQCQSINELLNLTTGALNQYGPFKIERAMYEWLKAAAWSTFEIGRSYLTECHSGYS